MRMQTFRVDGRHRLLVGALLFAGTAISPLEGQEVHARVFDSDGLLPLAGAIVAIETATGDLVVRSLTGEDGRVSFNLLQLGRYVLRVEMIGRETKVLRFELFEPEQAVQREIRLTARPISIEGLSVAAGERCRLAPDAVDVVRRVWDEARKALSATAVTDNEGVYRYETLVYERDLDRDLVRVEGMQEERRERDLRTPFITRPAADLLTRGFVERRDGSDLYFGPDAHLLLSDEFLETHCLTITEGEASADLNPVVGLSFRPLSDVGERVDIAGTLWLDLSSSELRHLDYQYTNLPEVRSDPRVGGRVDFKRTPEGRWIVSEWWIRMPSVSVQRDREYRIREFLSGFRESGGVVLEARRQGEAVIRGTTLGVLDGTVQDHDGRPLPGVRVDLFGTSRTMVTLADGRFEFPDLPEGLYEVLLTDARSVSYGLDPVFRGVRVGDEQSPNVLLELDSDYRLREECRSQIPVRPASAPSGPWPPGEGVLIVKILDGEGLPAAGVSVRVGWAVFNFEVVIAQPSPRLETGQPSLGPPTVPITATVGEEGFSYEGSTDESGVLRFCGVKEKERVTVTTWIADGESNNSQVVRLEDFAEIREVVLTLPQGDGREPRR